MSSPIVFISRNRVKEGLLEDFIRHYQNSIARTQVDKPGTLLQLPYLSEDASSIDIVRVFPDADALEDQLRGADDRSKAAYQFIEPTSVEIYGTPSDFALEMFKKVAGAGIPVDIFPQYTGGFIRPGSG